MIKACLLKIGILIILLLLQPTSKFIEQVKPNNAISVFYNYDPTTETNSMDDANKEEFQTLITELFHLRNYAIVTGDTEGLKGFYNLNRNVTKWAYEQEVQKLNYLSSWEDKQAVKFNSINSFVKVNRVKEKSKDLFVITCAASTEFNYSYEDTPNIENTFKLGTYHYINLQKEDSRYIITKEWYTDPFADSLEIKKNKHQEIHDYILKHQYPVDYVMDERTTKAMEYAHSYCGLGPGELLFKYNKNYTNFNPQGGDCANFASQILHEGGKFKKNGTWTYSVGEGSTAWVNAQAFKNYMICSGRGSYIAKGSYDTIYKSAYELRPGDFVAYEKKGKITHISTVTGLDSKGYPLVTCHNSDRLLVPFDLGWSNDNITFHLIDVHY